ncbi:uncharacterized protein BHQ10_004354 [Talaromyces amestolkiae]|uniref:Uncharacterized protein n=1 Tax=Talaromyces amestolkiae TaxID=1196081 RepID=A0A364KXR0_TALAM|nr:uncharacterized protein BHQ10_004354 [Talaromyces amestolkiae]RAO68342.1 hypothetical protein BHQ10_004354 [Talaromyces amestolkiae]
METRKSSSPDTVLGPEEVEAFSKAKDKLFITLYRKRATYFKRWLRVTDRYFTALEEHDRTIENIQRNFIDDVIDKYAMRIEHRKERFKNKFRHAVSDDGKTLPFLNGMDLLIWPKNRAHREELIEKENEYHQKNQKINPDTQMQKKPVSEGTPLDGNAAVQAQGGSEDWERQAEESDTGSVSSMEP